MTMLAKAARVAAVVALFGVPALALSDAALAATSKQPSAAAKACASHKKNTKEYKDCVAEYRKAHPKTAAKATKKPATAAATTQEPK